MLFITCSSQADKIAVSAPLPPVDVGNDVFLAACSHRLVAPEQKEQDPEECKGSRLSPSVHCILKLFFEKLWILVFFLCFPHHMMKSLNAHSSRASRDLPSNNFSFAKSTTPLATKSLPYLSSDKTLPSKTTQPLGSNKRVRYPHALVQLEGPICHVWAASIMIDPGEVNPGTESKGDPAGLNGDGQSSGLSCLHSASVVMFHQSWAVISKGFREAMGDKQLRGCCFAKMTLSTAVVATVEGHGLAAQLHLYLPKHVLACQAFRMYGQSPLMPTTAP